MDTLVLDDLGELVDALEIESRSDMKPIAILSNLISDPSKSIPIDIGWELNAGLWPAFL
ncbi:hypothetical protein [Natrinema soli]|uniref:Uncharacterized protein n=1 Tax=Natrinema soli TaxID=1930624 RepID=A0ABD5SN97_9EURY|nr:hypothetical protein [Natrinema soli]